MVYENKAKKILRAEKREKDSFPIEGTTVKITITKEKLWAELIFKQSKWPTYDSFFFYLFFHSKRLTSIFIQTR